MRFATIIEDGWPSVAVVDGGRYVPLAGSELGLETMSQVAAAGLDGMAAIETWVGRQADAAGRPAEGVRLGPAVPDPGAIYTVGLNYRTPDDPHAPRPERPLIYGKAPPSVAADGAVLDWDRSLTANVDPEVELGVVMGRGGEVFGYTIINDISSRDPWLDGDQWLLGKSMPGFCPVGPSIVSADELQPAALRLGTTINDVPIQEGSTDEMYYSIDEIVSFLGQHLDLRPGDLIATGTPPRMAGSPGPDRHLEAGDRVVVWIEGIGSLTTTVEMSGPGHRG